MGCTRSRQGEKLLLAQGDNRRGLIETLSSIGKARSSAYRFADVWARFIDHVYIVCGLVLALNEPEGER
jgi:hypothetical protein